MNAPLRQTEAPAVETSQPDAATPAPSRRSTLSRLRTPLMAGGIAVVLAGAAYAFVTGGRPQSTDDAYVQAAGVDISSNIAGRVVEIDVKENQQVKAGQLLFRLDPAPHDLAVAEAAAKVAEARQQIGGEIATYHQRQAQLANARDAGSYADRAR